MSDDVCNPNRRGGSGRRHALVRGAASMLLAVTVVAAGSCRTEPARRTDPGATAPAPATPRPPPESGVSSTDSTSRAPGDLKPDREGPAGNLVASDTIAPLGPPGAPANAFPKPNRSVAEITTDTWSDEATRDKAGEAERVMRLLEVREGMHVADIGAGSGYYTVRLSARVGAGGRVIAQDVVPRYLGSLRERVRREGLSNVIFALGDFHDPRLPPASIDLALMVHMYHEVEQPYGLLYNLYPALRSGARVAVIDLNRSTARHGTPPGLLRCEFAAVGYTRVALHDLGKGSGYLAVFEPPASRARLTVPESIEACAVR